MQMLRERVGKRFSRRAGLILASGNGMPRALGMQSGGGRLKMPVVHLRGRVEEEILHVTESQHISHACAKRGSSGWHSRAARLVCRAGVERTSHDRLRIAKAKRVES